VNNENSMSVDGPETPGSSESAETVKILKQPGVMSSRWFLPVVLGASMGIVMAVMMAVAIAVSYSVSLSYGRGEPLNNTSFLYEIPEFGFSFAQIFFGASFIVFVCTEWSSGFIYTTYGATQRPYGFVLAKLVWPLVFAVCVFSALLILLIPIEDVLVSNGTPYGVSFSDPVVWRQIVVANFNLMCSGLFAQGNGAAFVLRVVGVPVIAHVVFQGKDVLRIGVAQGGGFFPPLDCLGCSTWHAIGAVMDFAELVLGGGMVLVGGFFEPD